MPEQDRSRSAAAPAPRSSRRRLLPAGPLLLLAALVLAAALSAAALPHGAGERWLAIGPAGAAPAVGLEVDPLHPEHVYLGTSAGMFASRDGGASWQMSALPGLAAFAVHPASPRRLYAVMQNDPLRFRLWRSDDRGRSWKPLALVSGGGDGPRVLAVHALAVDPADPETVYLAGSARRREPAAGSAAEAAAGALAGRVWHSRDGGQTLAERRAPAGGALAAADLAVGAEGALFAATGEGVFRSGDGGATWSAARHGLETRSRGRHLAVRHLAASLDDPQLLHAATGPGGTDTLYISADGGRSWQPAGAAVPPGEVLDLVVDPRDRRSVYASVAGAGVYATRGGDWAAVRPSLPDESAPHRLALAPGVPRALFAATLTGDLYRRAPPPPSCVDDAQALCLGDRFRVDVDWWWPDDDGTVRRGSAHPVPLTRDGGWFWFGDRDSPEVAVKVLEGRPVDGRWWVSYTSLSDAGLDLRVFDVISGRFEVYRQPPGAPTSASHVAVFPAGGEAAQQVDDLWFAALPEGGCGGESIDLCLWGGRFEVAVDWRSDDGEEGAAVADRLGPRAGWFRFQRPGEPELFVEVHDGRDANGHWWVSFGSLSDLGFTLRVRDVESGESLAYEVGPGERPSHVDRTAFEERSAAEAAPWP
jgi:photosystem II stability/assembly factor-like uncharacterized protein